MLGETAGGYRDATRQMKVLGNFGEACAASGKLQDLITQSRKFSSVSLFALLVEKFFKRDHSAI
ncbi:hypothetical protein AWV80_10360 [Cupriavidus sp. UYMU48A]|nr:hypothetical protein AWV80_10360 [Cupriavidus sp. UYMU48A]